MQKFHLHSPEAGMPKNKGSNANVLRTFIQSSHQANNLQKRGSKTMQTIKTDAPVAVLHFSYCVGSSVTYKCLEQFIFLTTVCVS
jgi:hypothetical protein